jgi:ferredoxin
VNHDTNPPKFFNITLLTPQEERSIRVANDQHIWDAAFEQGIELPALCHQGWCLTCAGRIEGPGEVTKPIPWLFFLRTARRDLRCCVLEDRART